MDPKKKNMLYAAVIVLGLGYAGYAFMFSGGSSKAKNQQTTFKKKSFKAAEAPLKKGALKKQVKQTATTKKAGLVKREAKKMQKNTLKKRPGRRGNRKTKKKEVLPAA